MTATSVPTDRYAQAVLQGALAEVRRCCSGRAPDAGPGIVELHVETHTALSAHQEELLRADVDRMAWTHHGMNVVTYVLPVDPTLADETPDYAVKAALREDPAPAEPDPEPVPLARRELLRLTCGSVMLSYLLVPGDTWIPVRRRDQAEGDHRDEIVLPAELQGVSRDALVEVRLTSEGLELQATDDGIGRRAGRRGPDVTVLVDGLPPPSHALRAAGRLSFVAGADRTDIDYVLTPWRDGGFEAGAGRAVGTDDTPHECVLSVGVERALLRIEAPAVATRPKKRCFQVHAPQFREGWLPVYAEVLYSRAESFGAGFADLHWHVKIFRTATPQHADHLREMFIRQARAIRNVIVHGGGSLTAPPWGIAPVHVVNPADDLDAPAPETRIGAGPVFRAPDGRLREWFGAPADARPDCIVVVVSPWLEQATVDPTPPGPALMQLDRFRAMARALDRCHTEGVAHCDLKPDNYGKQGGDYVLIDGDSVTELTSRPSWLPFTLPYATARMLRDHHPERPGGGVLLAEDIRAHDCFGFGLLVSGAVVGSAWMGEAAGGTPGGRTIDKLADLRTALTLRWPDNVQWPALVDLLVEPFDEASVRQAGWTCEKWLDRVREQARTPPPVDARGPDRYDGPFARELAALRTDVMTRKPHQAQALPVVHAAVERCLDRVESQARTRWALVVGLAGLAVAGLFAAPAAEAVRALLP